MKIQFLKLIKSKNKDKKYTAIFNITKSNKDKTVLERSFGYNTPDDKFNDYTKNKDINRRNRYIIRHQKDLNTGDPSRAGYLSLILLWNKPTLKEAVKDYNKRLAIYNKTGKFKTQDLIDEATEYFKNKKDEASNSQTDQNKKETKT